MQQARLMRSSSDRMFAGVCGGVAAYLGIDAVFVRLAFVLLSLASGVGILLYFVLILLMPDEQNVGRTGSEVARENLEHFGDDVNYGVEKMRSHPNGPIMAAGLLILLGVYLLFNNFGWIPAISGTVLWSLALIGLGVLLLVRRSA